MLLNRGLGARGSGKNCWGVTGVPRDLLARDADPLYVGGMRCWWSVTLGSAFLWTLPWAGCSVDEAGYDFTNAGAPGISGSGGSGGSGGKGLTGGRSASGSSSFGGNSTGGRVSQAAGGGMAGSTEFDPGGTASGGTSSGGTEGTEPPIGTGGGETLPPIMGSCEADQVENCGDCGQRACDSTTLEWGPCVGDGSQQGCWETAEGEALPGEMPEAPRGKCTAGVQTCQAEGDWSACTGAVAPAAKDDCDVAGDDSDCDEMPNDGCTCTPGTMRACGKNDGNCQQGMQTCTDNTWGLCEGEIAQQAADSCLVTGDDANCNNEENEGCACVGDDPNACNDNVTCTDNVCNNGVCSNPVSAGFCRIGGTCYAHNAKAPGNPCQFCDANVNRTGWSNSPSTVTCDDNLWCNGADVCSAGSCAHEFTTNRCTATGDCALSVCDEQRDSCFRPNTFACSSTVQTRCSSTTACSGDVQTRTVQTFCTGNSAACNGTPTDPAWTTSSNCNANQVCTQSGSNYSCTDKLGCGSSWCAKSSGGLCWTTSDPGARTPEGAAQFCSTQTIGGVTWRLASIHDYLALSLGCNGTTGMPKTGQSNCVYVGDQFLDCNACPRSMGPGVGGCYWPSGMGACDVSASMNGGYWTSTQDGIPTVFDPGEGHGGYYPTTIATFQSRCVTNNPN